MDFMDMFKFGIFGFKILLLLAPVRNAFLFRKPLDVSTMPYFPGSVYCIFHVLKCFGQCLWKTRLNLRSDLLQSSFSFNNNQTQ